MALSGRTEFRNTNFLGSKTKTLSMPGLMARAWIKLAEDWVAILREHADDDPTFSVAFQPPVPGNKGNKAEDNKRYIGMVSANNRGVYNTVINYRNVYQYAPNNTTIQLNSLYGLVPGINVTTANPSNITYAQTDSNYTNITYNLTTTTVADFVQNTISRMQYYTIPQTIVYDSVKKCPKYSFLPSTTADIVGLYGDNLVVTGIDIVDKSTGTLLTSIKYGGTSTAYSPYIDSMSTHRAYGWSGSTQNCKYKSWIEYTTSKDYPATQVLPYDPTLYISEALGLLTQLTNNSNTHYAQAMAYDTSLTEYGTGLLCATTEQLLYAMEDNGAAPTTSNQMAFVIWRSKDSIIKYFTDNVGFGVTINDLDSALDPDTPNPGAQDDDGQPDNPTDDDPGDGDNDSDDINYPDPSIVPISGRKFYALTANQVNVLSNFLFSETFISNAKRLWSEPGEYIIDLSYYPCDLLNTGLDFAAETAISIGGVASDINAPELIGGEPYIYMGQYTPGNYYNSYLDYAPYTSLDIYLPYIGLRPLDINQVMGHTIRVGYYIDYATQQVMAAIGLDGEGADNLGQPIAQYTGSIAVHVPLSGSSAQQLLIGSIRQGLGVAANVGGIVGGALTGNVGGIVSNAAGLANNLIPEQVPRREYGNLTAMTGIYAPQQCFLIFDRPISAEPAGYQARNGYASSYGGTVSEFSGYLQCTQAVVTPSGTMTPDECNEIIDLLKGGIYV